MEYKDLLTRVSDLVKGSKDEVSKRVVDSLVEQQVAERTDKVAKGLALVDRLDKDIKKVKPDQRSIASDGTEQPGTFSPQKWEELKKLKERYERATKALDLAIEQQDFGKLTEVLQKEQGGGKQQQQPQE